MSFNKIFIVGNLGRDPELRYTPAGTPVCTFSIATNERIKDKSGQSTDLVTWFRVTAWQKMAETASQHLHKGKSVFVEGRLRLEEYTDRDGKPRVNAEVTATDIKFIGSNSEQRESPGTGGQPAQAKHELSDEDIPF